MAIVERERNMQESEAENPQEVRTSTGEDLAESIIARRQMQELKRISEEQKNKTAKDLDVARERLEELVGKATGEGKQVLSEREEKAWGKNRPTPPEIEAKNLLELRREAEKKHGIEPWWRRIFK